MWINRCADCTCVIAPAKTAQDAVVAEPLRENAKKAPPNSSSTDGVMKAATAQPRWSNTSRPPIISAIVTYPVAIDTSASTPCMWPVTSRATMYGVCAMG